jgi:hypothetical protein
VLMAQPSLKNTRIAGPTKHFCSREVKHLVVLAVWPLDGIIHQAEIDIAAA